MQIRSHLRKPPAKHRVSARPWDVRSSNPTHRTRRSGFTTLFIVLSLPAMVMAFLLVLNAGVTYLARQQAETAIEAGALFGVDFWAANANNAVVRENARTGAALFVNSNTVLDEPITVSQNVNLANPPNDNDTTTDGIILGSVFVDAGNLVFDADTAPDPGNSVFHAIRIRTTYTSTELFPSEFLGSTFNPVTVTVETIARGIAGQEPELVSVDEIRP